MEGNLTVKKFKANKKHLTSSDPSKFSNAPTSSTKHVLDIDRNRQQEVPRFVCDHCSKSLGSKQAFVKHQKMTCPANRKKPKYPFPCPDCPAKFKSINSYNKHQRISHNATFKLHRCAICFAEHEKRELISHYVLTHKINFKKSCHKFKNMEEFLSWKTSYQQKTNSKYFQGANKKLENGQRQRIGFFCADPHNSRSRAVTVKKSERSLCPAAIEVQISRKDQKLSVTVIETHLGHEVHSTDDKETIDKTRELPDENLILDNMDLQVAFNLCTKMHNCDDALEVNTWIKDLQLNNVVLFYKAKGCLLEEFEELTLDDSVLIIMTTLQAKILQKYSSNTVYIDWYQGKDCYLATMLVIDDKGEVFPCGFLIANQINKIILKVFLQHVKFKIGMQLHPDVLMTGLYSCFFEAWIETMGWPNSVWSCPWYVQESWRKWLNVSLVAYETKEAAYQKLRALLDETDQNVFSEQLSTVHTYLLKFKPLHIFASHFKNNFKVNFLTDPLHWCLCNSKLTKKSKTNFENMHKTLKSALWMEQNVKNRVDRTVGAIMRLVRDKSVNLISEESEEELQNIRGLISVNHEKSLEIDLGFVMKSKKVGWVVLSSDLTKLYAVEKVKDRCTCAVRCEECDSCLHQYVCSCVDASFSYSMCKHIHLFCRRGPLNESSENVELPFSDDDEDDIHNAEENVDGSANENVDSFATENVDSSATESVDSLTEDREELMANFQKMVESASAGEFLVIQRLMTTVKELLSDSERCKIVNFLR